MKSKKIKLIVFHPYSTIGGADKSIARLINGLNEKKYEIIFLTISRPYIKNYLNKKIKIIKINSSKTIFSIFKIRNILKKFSNNEKVIFFSNQNFANIISFFILYKFKNIKHVVVERNHIDEFNYYQNTFDYIKKKIIILLMIILYKKADLVIGNAKKLSEDLSKITKIKVKTIYNPAFDNSIFKLSKKKINIKKNKNIILNVGRLEIQKDQITILKAVKILKDKINFKLLIMGRGIEKNNLLSYVLKNNLSKEVKIINFQNNPYNLLKKADVFILSSKYEGLPNVLLEAAVLKKFIISTKCPTGPGEILENGKGGIFFKVGDYVDLSKKIKFYINNKKKLNKKIFYSYKKLNRFDYINNLNKYYYLINNFMIKN